MDLVLRKNMCRKFILRRKKKELAKKSDGKKGEKLFRG